jgi:hypothetical protein
MNNKSLSSSSSISKLIQKKYNKYIDRDKENFLSYSTYNKDKLKYCYEKHKYHNYSNID